MIVLGVGARDDVVLQALVDIARQDDAQVTLSWAFHEAAHFAVRFQPDAKRWYEKKRSKTCPLVAIRALAHKLARAAYFMMRDQVPYEPKRLFG